MLQNKSNRNITKLNKKIVLEIFEDKEENENENENYSIARSPYVLCESIPLSIIPIIMKHHFTNCKHILSYTNSHHVYKIMIKDILSKSVINWEYNRPPDMARCPDIARHIYNSKKPIDTMIYLSFNNLNETFDVLDGIHRITALKIIKEENSKEFNVELNEFGFENNAHWLYNQYLLVNIRFNATLGELIETFKNLNKSQNVPDLYICDNNKDKRNIIESIENEWFVKYKKHFSSSSNPNIGNTNRNKFIELLDKLYEKHKIRQCNFEKLKKLSRIYPFNSLALTIVAGNRGKNNDKFEKVSEL